LKIENLVAKPNLNSGVEALYQIDMEENLK